MRPGEPVVDEVCRAFHTDHVVGDALFIRAVAALGKRGVMDLVCVRGYCTLVSMVLDVAEIPLPDDQPPPWA